MNKRRKRNLRAWVTTLCAAALCLLSGQPARGQSPTTYDVTRVARSNTEFQFTMPANNVEVTVAYVDAGVQITNGGTTLYYETLADAFTDCADGDVIKLMADETLTTGITISKNVTLDLNEKTISTTTEGLTGLTVASGGSLTITGSGTISGFATAINNQGTLTLNSLPTFSGNTTDIELAADKKISIGTDFPATATDGYTPIKVKVNGTLPCTITSGFGTGKGNPATFFQPTGVPDGKTYTVRLKDGEAQVVEYKELTDETKPTNTATAPSGQGSRLANPAEAVWIGDVLTTATVAQPQYADNEITWQWYRVDAENNEALIDGATTKTYTVTTADLGCRLVVKATQPQDIAGTGNPPSTKEIASDMTAVVEKKDNFGTLTNAAYTLYDTDKVDYVKVELTNADAGVEYMVVASDVTPTEQHWSQAKKGTAAAMSISQYVAIENEEAVLKDMLPSTGYKLYYRLVETEDTKHGTTSTDNSKPQNEKSVAITTRTFDYRITTQGVTYELSHDATTGRALETTTAKVVAIVGTEGEGAHAGHKEATILAVIPHDNTELNARADVWKVLGYDVTAEPLAFNSDVDIEVPASGFPRNIDMSAFGSAEGSYGYLKVIDNVVYAHFNSGVQQTQCAVEGYKVMKLNNGFYTLCDAEGNYEYAAKGQTVDDVNMNDILQAEGMTGGSFVFEDMDGTPLPDGTGLTAGHKMAAPGQTVVVRVTLPDGFLFKDGDDNKKLTVSGTTGDITLTQVGTTNVYTAKFKMPEADVTVKFKETEPLLGREITVTAPATPENGTMTADDGNPTPIRVFSELKYTLTPDECYALTAIAFTGMPEGFTYTLKDGSNNDVTLPYDDNTAAITLSFQVPAAVANNVTITPTFTKTYENVTFATGLTTYYDSKGLKLHEANSNLTFYTVTAVGKSSVTLTQIDNIPANTPVIVENSGSAAATVRVDIDNELALPSGITVASQFTGTAEGTTLTTAEGTEYYGLDGKNFVWLKEGGSVAAHRCWLTLTTAAGARLAIEWPDGSTTRISGISADDEDGDWYDLNGRKLESKPQKKGVYIRNGRKQVVK